MITRTLTEHAQAMATQFPVVTVTGPRQSGKTTLARLAFPDHPYASLEAPDVRENALADPRGFLAAYPSGAILDEVQRAPDLLSYLQGIVDEPGFEGSWILTGSQDFALLTSLSQSLAGRTAVLRLLPPSLEELRRFPNQAGGLLETLFAGAYPRIHHRGIEPRIFHESYVATYLERDVRQVHGVSDLPTFQRFVGLCAGRSGSLVNFSSLGADAGVSQPTARAWLAALEASLLVVRLRPFLPNLNKRLIKTPKLYFLDSGLLCYLLGIRDPEQLRNHPMRGAVFETWVVSEVLKAHYHRGVSPSVFFYRDRSGAEVDLVIEHGGTALTIAEIKSGATMTGAFIRPLEALDHALTMQATRTVDRALIYGGDAASIRRGTRVVPWAQVDAWTRELI